MNIRATTRGNTSEEIRSYAVETLLNMNLLKIKHLEQFQNPKKGSQVVDFSFNCVTP